jgi:hypothetical protein
LVHEPDAVRERVAQRTAELAERFARPEEQVAEKEPEPLPSQVATGGYVDLVFDEGRLLTIRDHRGFETEYGNWIDQAGRRVLRIPTGGGLAPPRRSAGAVHAGGHDTEVEAARLQIPKSATDKAKVLAVLQRDWLEGGSGLIDEDIAARTGLYLYTAAPRRLDLVHEGWVEASGKYGRTKKDGKSKRWQLTQAAVDRLGLRRTA